MKTVEGVVSKFLLTTDGHLWHSFICSCISYVSPLTSHYYHLQRHFRCRECGFPPTPRNSQTPAGRLTIQLNSDTFYPGQNSQVKWTQATRRQFFNIYFYLFGYTGSLFWQAGCFRSGVWDLVQTRVALHWEHRVLAHPREVPQKSLSPGCHLCSWLKGYSSEVLTTLSLVSINLLEWLTECGRIFYLPYKEDILLQIMGLW